MLHFDQESRFTHGIRFHLHNGPDLYRNLNHGSPCPQNQHENNDELFQRRSLRHSDGQLLADQLNLSVLHWVLDGRGHVRSDQYELLILGVIP